MSWRRGHLPHMPTVGQDSRLGQAWRDRWVRRGIAVGVPALAALALGFVMPRGPITTGDGLTSMIVGALVGLVAGFALRSRWAMLLAPAVFVAVFELVRLGTDGPTVDGIHTSTYGFFAFAVGRGIHALLALAPMVLGAALGAGLGRRITEGGQVHHGRGRAGLYARRAVAALVGVGLALWPWPSPARRAPTPSSDPMASPSPAASPS